MKLVIATLCAVLSLEAHAELERGMQDIPAPAIRCSGLDLFEAINSKDPKCLQKSLRHMDVSETDSDGNTPLHIAIQKRNRRAILFFVRHGADLKKINFQGLIPSQQAEQYGYFAEAAYLTKIETETERLADAIEFNDLKRMKDSLKRGASVGTRDVRQDTLLHRAVQSGFVEAAKLLLQTGASIEARNYLGETPLFAAALQDDEGCIRALVRAGANVNAMNERRETALDLASAHEKESIQNLLHAAGAKYGRAVNVGLDISGE